MSNTIIIANPIAGAGLVRRNWPTTERVLRQAFGPLDLQFTSGPGDAVVRTRAALREGAARIVAVGGDGTFNEVVNGFFDEDGERFLGAQAVFVPCPSGTGDDLARSIGCGGGNLAEALAAGHERSVDVGRVRLSGLDGEPLTRMFINIASFGASGRVVDLVNRTSKAFGSRVAFQLGTIRGVFGFRNTPVRLQVDEHFDELVTINTIAVANARYFGGGMQVAPAACIDDGLLDVTVLGDVSPLKFCTTYVPAMREAKHGALPQVISVRGRSVTASVPSGVELLVDTDGELAGRLPIRCDLLPGRLRMFAPWAEAEARADRLTRGQHG